MTDEKQEKQEKPEPKKVDNSMADFEKRITEQLSGLKKSFEELKKTKSKNPDMSGLDKLRESFDKMMSDKEKVFSDKKIEAEKLGDTKNVDVITGTWDNIKKIVSDFWNSNDDEKEFFGL